MIPPVVALAVVAPAHAACTFDAPPERLDRALRAAEAAYVQLQVDAFQTAMTEVDFMVPCLVEPVGREVAVRLHRVRGLGSFIDGDPDAARDSLQAARYLAPAFVFPEEVMPTGFELRDVYEELPTQPEATQRLPRPRGGEVFVNGTPTRERPADAAALVQVFVAGDEPVSTYLSPAEPLPYYPGVDRTRTALLVGAGATSLGAAALYAGAWSAHGRLDRAVDEDDLQARQATTNGLVGAASAAAVASAVQVGLGLFVGRRR